jgi:hypothetical protein
MMAQWPAPPRPPQVLAPRFFTTNPTKLGLHFSDFSTIFYEFSKIQQKHFTI